MSLKKYASMRDFKQTPEPSGAAAKRPAKKAAAKRLSFVVQMHHATRLHWDFRLEADGVLKSWAVPKGPSLNPADKRLAMMVEDHPLTYATFSGEIPAGNYGAGTVEIWDNGTFTPVGEKSAAEQIQKGDLKFSLDGKKLHGEIALFRIKGKDKHADPEAITAADEDLNRPHIPKSKRGSNGASAPRPKRRDNFPTGLTP